MCHCHCRCLLSLSPIHTAFSLLSLTQTLTHATVSLFSLRHTHTHTHSLSLRHCVLSLLSLLTLLYYDCCCLNQRRLHVQRSSFLYLKIVFFVKILSALCKRDTADALALLNWFDSEFDWFPIRRILFSSLYSIRKDMQTRHSGCSGFYWIGLKWW